MCAFSSQSVWICVCLDVALCKSQVCVVWFRFFTLKEEHCCFEFYCMCVSLFFFWLINFNWQYTSHTQTFGQKNKIKRPLCMHILSTAWYLNEVYIRKWCYLVLFNFILLLLSLVLLLASFLMKHDKPEWFHFRYIYASQSALQATKNEMTDFEQLMLKTQNIVLGIYKFSTEYIVRIMFGLKSSPFDRFLRFMLD